MNIHIDKMIWFSLVSFFYISKKSTDEESFTDYNNNPDGYVKFLQ